MDFLAISYTFRLAGDELRSQLSFTPEQKAGFEQQMIAAGLCRECLILSTCNRVEFYLAGGLSDHHQLIPRIYQELAENKALATSQLSAQANFYTDTLAVRHLMRVACGLDSMLLCEDQILGQIREADRLSRQAGTTANFLADLLQAVYRCASRFRHRCGLQGRALSIPSLGVQQGLLLLDKQGPVTALVLGASGRTGLLVIRELLARCGRQIHILATYRTLSQPLVELGQQSPNLTLVEYSQRLHFLEEADLVFSATLSPHLTVTAEQFGQHAKTLKQRILVDLAMPMDLDPVLGQLPETTLVRLDQLQMLATENSQHRKAAACQGENLVETEADAYAARLLFRQKLPQVRQVIQTASNLVPYYSTQELLTQMAYNVRDLANAEELEIFLKCLEKGLSSKALMMQRRFPPRTVPSEEKRLLPETEEGQA
ncbi:MAG: hypothetical protein EOM08_08585 [Clostridia bacterium]|nr:hypothetical protein [Clostridia bacterium]NCC76473.1 hypothetical protein [Clostridia bacterium]